MTAYDPDLTGPDLDLDLLDFDLRDSAEAHRDDRFSASLSGYPARPGVRRRIAEPAAMDLALVADALLDEEP